eukprot:SAG11_NODE_195_length_12838_cov_15.711045_2_plen_121_part_00
MPEIDGPRFEGSVISNSAPTAWFQLDRLLYPAGKMDVADPLDEDMQKLEHLGKLKPLFFGGEGQVWATPCRLQHHCVQNMCLRCLRVRQFAEAKVRMFSYYNKKNACVSHKLFSATNRLS